MTAPIHQSYVDLLKEELLRRKSKNSRYSLRAFSKQLQLSPAYISLVFRGRRHLSPYAAAQIAKKLRWSAEKQKYFVTLSEFENPATDKERLIALRRLHKQDARGLQFHSLDVDVFATITNWYHNAILSLLTLPRSKPASSTTHGIAKRLGLDVMEAEIALKRLERLELVQKQKNHWVATQNFLRVKSTPSQAIRLYHQAVLQMAHQAIDEQPFEGRDFSNMTLTLDRSQLPLAKKKIAEFQSEMATLLEGKNPTEVYQLSVQLFRLTK